MADIAAVLKTYWKTISDITDVVGAGTASKIGLHQARQSWAAPYIVFHVFEDDSFEHLAAVSGLITSRVTVETYGTSSSQAHSLSELVRTSLMTKGGTYNHWTMGSTYINAISSPGGYERDFVPPQKGREVVEWFCSRDYLITYGE